MSCRYYLVDPQPFESFLESVSGIGLKVTYQHESGDITREPVHKNGGWIIGSGADRNDDGMVHTFLGYHPDEHIIVFLAKELGLKCVTEYNIYDYLDTRFGPKERDDDESGNDPYLDVIGDDLSLEEIWEREYGDSFEERIHCPLRFLSKKEKES